MFRGILRVITSGIVIGFFMTAAATTAAAATRTGTAARADNNWTNAGELGRTTIAPEPGDSLIFPPASSIRRSTNNFPAGTKFGIDHVRHAATRWTAIAS